MRARPRPRSPAGSAASSPAGRRRAAARRGAAGAAAAADVAAFRRQPPAGCAASVTRRADIHARGCRCGQAGQGRAEASGGAVEKGSRRVLCRQGLWLDRRRAPMAGNALGEAVRACSPGCTQGQGEAGRTCYWVPWAHRWSLGTPGRGMAPVNSSAVSAASRWHGLRELRSLCHPHQPSCLAWSDRGACAPLPRTIADRWHSFPATAAAPPAALRLAAAMRSPLPSGPVLAALLPSTSLAPNSGFPGGQNCPRA